MTTFDFEDYKALLRHRIRENVGFRGYQTQLAKAAGCQRSFLSQVLHGDLHLTRDHAAEMSRFWNLDDAETQYFVALVDLARAGSPQLREMIRKQLSSLREQGRNVSQRLLRPKVDDVEAQSVYYSSWFWGAIHVGLSVPGLNTAQALSSRLQLPLELVKNALARLEQMGLVERSGNQWKIGARDIHLPEHSTLSEAHHANWKQRAILDVQKRSKNSLHYASVFTMSRKDAERIRALMTEALLAARALIPPSPEEEIYCLSCDFFEL